MQSFFLCLSALAICLISYSPSALSFVLNSKCTRKYSSSMINFQRSRPVGRTICTMSVSDEEVDAEAVDVDNDYDVSEETLDILDSEIIPELEVSETLEPEVAEVVDPYEVAVKALEAQLRTEIINIESNLKSERNALSKIKDKASESGKNGYFIVQAKVAEFQKVKAVEQKARVTRNKREFVSKMLPVVDAFRAAPSISPSTSDREESMHKNFGSLLSSIMVVFEKYGFKEFDAGKNDYFPAHKLISYDVIIHNFNFESSFLCSAYSFETFYFIQKLVVH